MKRMRMIIRKAVGALAVVGVLLTGRAVTGQEQQDTEEIKQQIFDLGDIIVTGMTAPETATFFPGLVEVITAEEIKNSRAKNLLEIMGFRAGIWSARNWTLFGIPFGQGADGLNIRGHSSFDSVAVVINGRQDNMMNIMGHPIFDSLMVDNIERVEVYKGPASVLFGSNARGGVVNVITKKGGDAWFRIYQSYGSHNTRETQLSYGDTDGALDVYATTSTRGTSGHLSDAPAPAVKDTGAYKGEHHTLHLGYDFGRDRRLSLDWRFNWFEGWLPDDTGNPVVRNRWGLDLMYEVNRTRRRNTLHLWHGQGAHKTSGPTAFDSMDVSDGVVWTRQMNVNDRNVLLLGGEYQRYGGRARNLAGFFAGGAAGPGWHARTLYSLFAADTHQFSDQWSANAGLRAVHDFISGWNWVPQAGIEYRPNHNSALGLSYSKAYYTPSLRESLLFPRNFNPDLQPEFTEQIELNYTLFRAMKWKWQSAVFMSRNWNRIQQNNFVAGPPGWPPDQFINYPGDEKITGFETSWTRYWPGIATLNLSYTFLKFKNSELGEPLAGPFVPPDPDHKDMAPERQVNLNLDYFRHRLKATVNALYAAGVYSGGGGGAGAASGVAAKRDDYVLVNLHLRYPVWDDSAIFVSVHNALDQKYSLRDFETRDGGGEWRMPGRTVTGGVEWVW